MCGGSIATVKIISVWQSTIASPAHLAIAIAIDILAIAISSYPVMCAASLVR